MRSEHLVAYIDGELSAQESSALEVVLAEDRDARRLLARFYRQRLMLALIAADAVPKRTPRGVSAVYVDRLPPQVTSHRLRRLARSRVAGPRTWLSLAAVLALAIVSIWQWGAATPAGPHLVTISGEVALVRHGQSAAAIPGERLREGDVIMAPAGGSAEFAWGGGTSLVLASGELRFGADEDDPGISLRLAHGRLEAQVAPQPPGRPLVVATPHARAVVRGTRFRLAVDAATTHLDVVEGLVSFEPRDRAPLGVGAGGSADAGSVAAKPPPPETVATVVPASGTARPLLAPEALLGAQPWSASGQQPWARVVPGNHPSFAHGLRVVTPADFPASPYDVGEYALRLRLPTNASVAAGEVALGRLWLRAGEGAEARARLVIEDAAAPYTKALSAPLVAGPTWTLAEVSFRFPEARSAGAIEVQVWLGQGAQTIELGGLEVLAYGRRPMAGLPGTGDYPGRAAGSPWRAAAAARIDRLRRGELTVAVVDPTGAPVAGVAVRVEHLRPTFVIAAPVLRDAIETVADPHRDAMLSLVSEVVLESETKWPQWASDPAPAAAGTAWAARHGLPARGHAAVWPRLDQLPPEVQPWRADPVRLRAALRAHVSDIVGALAGRVAGWDLVNDPYSGGDVLGVVGEDEIASWFAAARAADPAAGLWLSCQGVLDDSGLDRRRQDWYLALARRLRAADAPIDGLSLQAHIRGRPTPPEQLITALDAIAAAGLPLRIGEFDVELDDPAHEADYARDALTAIASHPAVGGVALWGLGWSRRERPATALFADDGRPTPQGAALASTLRTWTAPLADATGVDGRCRLRVWAGEVRVSVDGAAPQTLTVGQAGADCAIVVVPRR